MVVDIYNSNLKYDIIYSDPPWQQTKGGLRKCRPRQGKVLDYQTISLEEIKEIQKQASNISKENHTLFIWTIEKYLLDTEKMLEELGYKRHIRIVWDKENGIAPSFTIRFSHEYLIWCYKGKMQSVAQEIRGKFTSVIRERSTKHSKKPLAAYELIEALYPNTEKIELFARNTRANWDSWGNEL